LNRAVFLEPPLKIAQVGKQKGGAEEPADHAQGYSRWGLTTNKIHMHVMPKAYRYASCSPAVRPATLFMLSRSWTTSVFLQTVAIVRTNDARGCLPTKATTAKR